MDGFVLNLTVRENLTDDVMNEWAPTGRKDGSHRALWRVSTLDSDLKVRAHILCSRVCKLGAYFPSDLFYHTPSLSMSSLKLFPCFCRRLREHHKSLPASAMAPESWSCAIFQSLPALLFRPLSIIVSLSLSYSRFMSGHLTVPQLRGITHFPACQIQHLRLIWPNFFSWILVPPCA